MSKRRSKYPRGRLYRTIREPKPQREGKIEPLANFFGLMPRGWPGEGRKVWRTKKAKFSNPKVSATKVKR